MNLKDPWKPKFWVDSVAFYNCMVREKDDSLDVKFPVAL